MSSESKYLHLTNLFEPIQLDEINQLRLLKRVDKKFVMPIGYLEKLLSSVKDDYRILEIENLRDFGYHTTYFDTPELALYLDHQNQRANRFKIRTRDYMVSNNSFLEIKRKTNKGRTIKSRISIEKCTGLNDDHHKYIESVVPIDSSKLVKSSENTFRRITIVSFKTLERITLDYDLKFYRNGKTISMPFISIVEIKKDRMGSASPVNHALKNLNIYPRGFSKYSIGLTYLIPELKQNSFKQTKLFLNKLNYATTSN